MTMTALVAAVGREPADRGGRPRQPVPCGLAAVVEDPGDLRAVFPKVPARLGGELADGGPALRTRGLSGWANGTRERLPLGGSGCSAPNSAGPGRW